MKINAKYIQNGLFCLSHTYRAIPLFNPPKSARKISMCCTLSQVRAIGIHDLHTPTNCHYLMTDDIRPNKMTFNRWCRTLYIYIYIWALEVRIWEMSAVCYIPSHQRLEKRDSTSIRHFITPQTVMDSTQHWPWWSTESDDLRHAG